MKFYPIPDPRAGAVTKEMLADLAQTGVMPRNIGAFASQQHWLEATHIGFPAEGAGAKYWRDNSAIWRSDEYFQYLMLDRNPDGTLVRLPFNLSDSTFRYYSPVAAQFYNHYRQQFPFLPRLVVKRIRRADAVRLNISEGPSEDYPLGVFTDETTHSFPSNMALRFHPQTGQPEAFYIEDYLKEFPIEYTQTIKTGQRLTDDELVGAVSGVVGSNLTVQSKAAAIRQLANR